MLLVFVFVGEHTETIVHRAHCTNGKVFVQVETLNLIGKLFVQMLLFVVLNDGSTNARSELTIGRNTFVQALNMAECIVTVEQISTVPG